MVIITLDDLTTQEKELLSQAERAMERAYSPYSKFKVGAAVLCTSGEIITGANVENASYGLVICAERVAMTRANMLGHRSFTTIAIIARGEEFDTKEATLPCGACRQFMNEFASLQGNNITILSASTKKDKIIRTTIQDILPMAFGPSDLGVALDKYK